jgi:hypothetical protein
MDEEELRNDGDFKEFVFSAIPEILRVAAEKFEACYNERGLFMAAMMKLMLDNGVYDATIVASDMEFLKDYSLLVSNSNDAAKVSIVFPDQRATELLE